jgi:hypothetical protein
MDDFRTQAGNIQDEPSAYFSVKSEEILKNKQNTHTHMHTHTHIKILRSQQTAPNDQSHILDSKINEVALEYSYKISVRTDIIAPYIYTYVISLYLYKLLYI